jgi:hypothetical protein
MTKVPKKKNLIDAALITSLGGFAFKSITQAIVGWAGLEIFKSGWKKLKSDLGIDNGKSDSQGISQEKPTKET